MGLAHLLVLVLIPIRRSTSLEAFCGKADWREIEAKPSTVSEWLDEGPALLFVEISAGMRIADQCSCVHDPKLTNVLSLSRALFDPPIDTLWKCGNSQRGVGLSGPIQVGGSG
jgi:hypothetical protein